MPVQLTEEQRLAIEKQYWQRLLAPVIDGRVEDIILSVDTDGTVWPGLLIETNTGNRKTIWFMSDEKGKEPGAVSVEPYLPGQVL